MPMQTIKSARKLMLDLLQVALEDTQCKCKIVRMNNGSNVWGKDLQTGERETRTLSVLMNN